MNDLIKHSELTPVSFIDKGSVLSVGQENLMRLLVERIKESKPITQDDILDCYFKVASKNGETVRVRHNMGWNIQHFVCQELGRTDSIVKARANSWFRQNLGACIIKGRLLVIPVIELLNSEQEVQVSDTTDDDSSTKAD